MKILLLGHPVSHSISPAIQNAALAELGLPQCYSAVDVHPSEVSAAVASLRDPDTLGCNVTVPHKQAVLPYLDELTPDAARIGAANTIVNRSGRLIGHNTDVLGFTASLREEGIEPRGTRALLLGAGGAARAIAFALADAGVEWLAIANRGPERARALAEDVRRQRAGTDQIEAGGLDRERLQAWLRATDLIVNSTTVGMDEPRSPLAGCDIRRQSVVCDIIYNPPETELLRQARAAGARGFNGLGMLVHQAALALTLWTGQSAPLETMYAAARQALTRRQETQ